MLAGKQELRPSPQVDDGFVESQIQMLKSDNVATIVVEKLNLNERPRIRAATDVPRKVDFGSSAEKQRAFGADLVQEQLIRSTKTYWSAD